MSFCLVSVRMQPGSPRIAGRGAERQGPRRGRPGVQCYGSGTVLDMADKRSVGLLCAQQLQRQERPEITNLSSHPERFRVQMRPRIRESFVGQRFQVQVLGFFCPPQTVETLYFLGGLKYVL